jgi:hypothetical protein
MKYSRTQLLRLVETIRECGHDDAGSVVVMHEKDFRDTFGSLGRRKVDGMALTHVSVDGGIPTKHKLPQGSVFVWDKRRDFWEDAREGKLPVVPIPVVRRAKGAKPAEPMAFARDEALYGDYDPVAGF